MWTRQNSNVINGKADCGTFIYPPFETIPASGRATKRIFKHLADVPKDVLKLLRERAVPEDAYQMKRQRPAYRYALMAVLLHSRRMELTDNIIDIFLTLNPPDPEKGGHKAGEGAHWQNQNRL